VTNKNKRLHSQFFLYYIGSKMSHTILTAVKSAFTVVCIKKFTLNEQLQVIK